MEEENNYTLESESEGTPIKEERGPSALNETSVSPSPYFNYLIIAVIVLLLLAIVFLFLLGKDGQECLSNPLVYGANKVVSDDSGGLLCRCYYNSPMYAPFYFNTTELRIGNSYSP